MNRNHVVSSLLAALLTMSATGHADKPAQNVLKVDGYRQSTSDVERVRDGSSSNHADLVKPGGKTDKDKVRNEQFDEMVNREVGRAAEKIRSACDGNKIWDQKISAVEKGLHDLLETATNYSRHEDRLKINTRILLAEIRRVYYDSGVTKFNSQFKDWTKRENIFVSFVTSHKFMNNIGDSVTYRDFRQRWARDMAQGLACLYE